MIDKLEMFIALANERHFGRAAEAVGVTQPSLSSAIKQLEDQLGVQLVFRGARFQGLTPEGQRVLDWALRIVGDTRTMREEMKAIRTGVSGNLRLGVIPTALPMVGKLTVPFLARNPNVRVTILSRTSYEILEEIDRLELEAGITYLENEPLGKVTAVPLYQESYRLLVATGSPLSKHASVTWREAAAQPLCLLTGNMQNRRIVDKAFSSVNAHPTPRLETNSIMNLLSSVKSMGLSSIMPEYFIATLGGFEGIKAIPLVNPKVEHTVGLVALDRQPRSPLIETLFKVAAKI